jgi:predicted nucleic acid-binding protein
MTIIVDTDTLIGLTIATDVHHVRVVELYNSLPPDTTFYVLSDTLCEFATLSTIKVGREKTQRAVTDIVNSHVLITLEPNIAFDAVQLYQKQTSKGNSLFDCAVMSAATSHKTDCIFSFDKGYKQNGFVLLEDFLSNSQSSSYQAIPPLKKPLPFAQVRRTAREEHAKEAMRPHE